MSIQKRIDQILFRDHQRDEPLCLICHEQEKRLSHYFYLEEPRFLCSSCEKKFISHKKTYRIDGIDHHVLYEYDEWSERLLFQYKEQRDILLAYVFFYLEQDWIQKKSRRKTWIALCSSEKKRAERGFEPLLELFKVYSIPVYSPFYKIDDRKQSSLNKEQREGIKKSLKLKEGYWFPDHDLILVDDVITTGATLRAACALLPIKEVFVLFAHPLWIEEHKKNRRRSSSFFD